MSSMDLETRRAPVAEPFGVTWRAGRTKTDPRALDACAEAVFESLGIQERVTRERKGPWGLDAILYGAVEAVFGPPRWSCL